MQLFEIQTKLRVVNDLQPGGRENPAPFHPPVSPVIITVQ